MSEVMDRRYIYLDLAREHCLVAMDSRLKLNGENDPQYLWSRFTYGTILASEEKYLEAQELLSETLREYREAVGQTAGLGTMLNDISLFFEHVGQADKALLLMEECVQVREAVLGRDHETTEYSKKVLEYLRPLAEEVVQKTAADEAKLREKEKAKEKKKKSKS